MKTKCTLISVAAGLLSAGIVGGLLPLKAIALESSPLLAANSTDSIAAGRNHESGEDLMAVGRELYSLGQFSAAAEKWKQAADIAKSREEPLTQAIALSYLSSAYQELNQWDLAQRAVDDGFEILEREPSRQVDAVVLAQTLNTKAGLAYHLGQAESALDLWEQAEASYQRANDKSGVLGSRINQAQALQSLGFYRRSRQQLEVIAQQLTNMPDSELKVNGLRTLGTALQVLGDLPASRAALFESANIAVALDSTTELSATYLSLGRTAEDWGDMSAAMEMFELARGAAVNADDALQADLNRLRLYVEVDMPAEAAPLASEIVSELAAMPPSRLSVYGAVNLSASLAKEKKRGRSLPIEQTNQLLSTAVKSAQSLGDKQAEAYALDQQGALYMQNGQWTEARQLTEKSLEIARSISADDIASQSAWQLGRILKQQGNTTEAIAAYSEAVDSLQSLRSDLVAIDPDVQFSFRENIEPIYRELVGLLVSDKTNASGQPSQENLAKAREVIEALQLAELDNFFQEACIDVESQQIDQVDPLATVVYPIILSDRLAVIASSSGKPLAYYETMVDSVAVESMIHELLSAVHPVSDNSKRLALSEQVYNMLIRPAEENEVMADTETMVFVLDGLLRNVPMAALYDGEQYLIEKYAVALSPGLQLMSARSLDQIKTDAVVGGISEARNGLSALPAVKEEISDISQLVSADTLVNEEFTSERLAKDIENSSASIVHLATHGQFSSRLEDTFLSTWEGRLNVKELSEILKSRGASSAIELLVLSACDTASGDDRAVLGLAGLAVQSGARSTVATLWPVKDKAAAKLMKALYEGIDEPGISKAEALRQAQLKLIADPTYSDPFFWSAYTLVGNWQ